MAADQETNRPLTPVQAVRAATVVSGGPLALALGSLLAPVAAWRRWPDRLSAGAARRAAWWTTVAGVAAPWVYATLVEPRLRRWGSTEEERSRSYPGDVDDPLCTSTRAVTVHAPAEEVWKWLVQIGQDRGGFYSYDFLENLAGCDIHSADEIRPELQGLAEGDRLLIFPGFGTRISQLDPPRSLVIEGWGAYVVEPVNRHSCRLVARSHVDRGPGAVPAVLMMELPHAIMEHRMLCGIRKRAERAERDRRRAARMAG